MNVFSPSLPPSLTLYDTYVLVDRRVQGDIIEGSDSEIRAAVFVLALVREWEPAKGALSWKVAEVAMHGSQLYL